MGKVRGAAPDRREYLDLLKKVLTYSLWPEPLVPWDLYSQRGAWWWIRWLVGIMESLTPLRLARYGSAGNGAWKAYAHTMVSVERLENLERCIEAVVKDGVAGDFIETGVWRGGACIWARALLEGTERRVWVADSFEGLPAPEVAQDAGDQHHRYGCLAVSETGVRNAFSLYGFPLPDPQVVFLRGWFKDTLRELPREQRFAVIRLDGDMYASTMDALEALWPRLSVGGFCIIDDWGLPGCRRAVEDYRRKARITEEIVSVDGQAVYWRRSTLG